MYISGNNVPPFLRGDYKYFSSASFYQTEQTNIINNFIFFYVGITPSPKYIEQFKDDVGTLSFCLNPLL